jgi:peptide deformylase
VQPIVQIGDPVLRKMARPLRKAELRGLKPLLDILRDTMHAAPGVGLAAPQIGRSVAVAVVEDRAEYQAKVDADALEERERAPVPFHALINPRLEVVDPSPVEFFEGCLSLDGFVALVPRARAVRVTGLNLRGHEVVIEAHGWHARILQHEIDHLNGILYVDRMTPRTLMHRQAWEEHYSDLSIADVREALGVGATSTSAPSPPNSTIASRNARRSASTRSSSARRKM